MTTDKYCPRGEIKKLESDKIEKYVRGLPDMIHRSVMASKPKTMQDAIELMDKKISILAERQAENKSGERKEYAETLPLCNKCKFHHNGQCTVKCANCKRVGHLTRDCRSHAATNNQRNLTWYEYGNQGHYKITLLDIIPLRPNLGVLHGQILDEEQLAFLAHPGVPDGQAVQTIIPNNAAFQTEDLDMYDSDCDDISNAQAVLMANIFNYGSDVISEVPHSETYLNDMENQSVHAMQDFEQTPAVDVLDNEIHSDSNIIPYSQYLEEMQQANVQDTHLQAQQDSMILSVIEQMSEQMINHESSFDKHVAIPVIDDEETLILEEKSRSKMSEKAKDLEIINKNISHKPIDYEKLNRLSEDFGKRFTPQQEMDVEQALWLRISNPTSKPSDASPVKIEPPKELPKVSLVNESLKKLKFHLARFDNVVKIRTTPDARTEVFNQIDADVQQFSVNKQCLTITKKELLLENDQLLQQIMSQEVLLTVMNSMSLIGESVNMDGKRKETCNLEAELLKSQNTFNDLLKRHSQLEKHCIYLECSIQLNQEIFQERESCDIQNALKIPEFSAYNDLKAQLQDKDSTILKCSTSKCGSKPTGNKRNDRISQTPIRNMKNKLNANSDLNCATCSSKKVKIVESKNANHSKPNHTWGSNATDIPSSSSSVMTGYPDCSLVSGLWMFKTHDKESLSAHELFAFRKNTCFIRNLEGVDLLFGSRDINLYTISLDDMLKTSPICLLSKASKTKSWLWHRRLSHLKFGTINKLAKDGLARGITRLQFQKDHLCSACALGKSKKSSHQPKAEDINQEKLYLLHIDLCGPMRMASINGKRYILVIVNDYSRFTWVIFLRTKDEAPEAIIKCIKNIQVRLNATVRNVRTDNGTEFVNQTLFEFYENVGISHQTSVACTPQQNGIVERRN
ncbi:retrovirus-related pol polyprotein from transposon TNT 1-94 [Tanacetum coccineum]